MARERSPLRDKAYELWKQSGGGMKLKDIATQLGISDIQVRKWKSQDHWNKVTLPKSNSNVTNNKGNVTKEAFPGQCEANGHKTGQRCQKKAKPGERFCAQHLDGWPGQCTGTSRQTGERCRKPVEPGKTKCRFHGGKNMGPPPGSQNALRHGFFARIFPDDEETRALVGEIMEKSPLDIIWENIIINYTAIARAQKTMFVTHKREMIKELKKIKSELDINPRYDSSDPDSKLFAETHREEEWEFQFAWDRQATFMKAQSEAMKTLERLIARYEEMIQKGNGSEEHQLRLEKLKQDMAIARERMDLEKSKVMGDPEETADDGFIDALSGKAGEAWDGYSEED